MISTTRSMAPMGILPSTDRTSLMWPSRSIATVGVRSISCIARFLPQSEIARNGWRSGRRAGSAVSNTLRIRSTTIDPPSSTGRTEDRRVDRDRHRPAEQANEHLDALGRVQVFLENRVDHCQRTALDHDRLARPKPRAPAGRHGPGQAQAQSFDDVVSQRRGGAVGTQDAANAGSPLDQVPAIKPGRYPDKQ